VEREPVSTPLISVVLTTYNRSKLLPRAIDSVLKGSYSNFELIVIDDASPDDTEQVVTRIGDPRVRYVRQLENRGVLCARNRGFDMAAGDYVTMLDDDDELVADALASVVSEFENPRSKDVNILWFDCQDAESGEISGSMVSSSGDIGFDDYLCGRIRGDFWMAFRKIALHGNRFNESLAAHESLLWLRMHRAHKARYIAKVLCKKYRQHGQPRLCDLDVRLGQLKQTTLALSLVLEEFGDILTRTCPTAYGRRLAYLGLHQMAINDFASGRSSILRSLSHRFSAKYLLLYLSSFFIAPTHVIALIARMES
jgi:glycosyltransferase involved in cell wall biosynthesis